MSDLKSRFNVQRTHARIRGIEWKLTFDEWLDIWQSSGKLHLRGRTQGQYVMCRKGDTGPYSIDNVLIDLQANNNKDGHNKPVIAGGIKFNSLKEAAEYYNHPDGRNIRRKIKAKKEGYEYV